MGNQQLVKKNDKLLEAQKFNIDSKRFSVRQNFSPDNVFLYETLHTTPKRPISLTQAVILSSTSHFFATIAVPSNMMRLQVKYLTIIPRVRMGY